MGYRLNIRRDNYLMRYNARAKVGLSCLQNRWGDQRTYDIRCNGVLFGRFENDVDAALARYRQVRDAALLMLDIQEGIA